MKKCSHCKKFFDKEIALYCSRVYKDNVYEYFMCHECNRNRARNYRKNSEYSKKYLKLKNRDNYRKNKDKVLARASVGKAIKNGQIIKPKNCSKCAKCVKLHAHHEDYSKPLEVIWLCVPCHHSVHS